MMQTEVRIEAEGADDQIDGLVGTEIERMVPEGFLVQDEGAASWVVRKIVQAREYGERIKVWAEMERRRAEAEERHLLFRFEGQLRAWAEGEVAKLRGRRKSLSLPGGTLGFRAVPSRVLIRDEELVVKWAKRECPEAIVVSERLVKTPITDYVQRTGEIPAGVEVTAPCEVFFVR